MNITAKLQQLADAQYRDFQAKLIPIINKSHILGVRTPVLRRFAKDLWRHHQADAEQFLAQLPHQYYDENNLHAFLIEQAGDLGRTLELTEQFLPFVDNWATCDSFTPPVFKRYPEEIYSKIQTWLRSDCVYTVRYGMGLLLSNFLDEQFQPVMIKQVMSAKSGEYYIQMMQAWYLATALVKQFDATLPYFESKQLPTFVHNKAIQKAIESRRISPELKQYLRGLKISR
ncbi:MAG: DNA alkylation repair protein [Candidatus Saccharibacteria bacterium]|nr:DNA alkylation repair protein [Candidatus Saccharibacteria bacterium]